MSIGGSATRGDVWLRNQRLVPDVTLGMATGDPADSMFNTTNFPGASSTDLTNARNLYAVLTGPHQLDHPRGAGRRGRRDVQDAGGEHQQGAHVAGRVLPAGCVAVEAEPDDQRRRALRGAAAVLRPQQQLFDGLPGGHLRRHGNWAAVSSVGSTVSGLGNLFKPGAFQGSPNHVRDAEKNMKAYNTDWNNFAPSIGAAWTTGADTGLLHTMFGSHGGHRGARRVQYRVPARRHERLHGGVRRQPGHPDRRHAQPDQREPRAPCPCC